MTDRQRKRFEKFVQKRMDNFDTFAEDISEAIYVADKFFQKPDSEIKRKVWAKLDAGGKEHGNASFDLTPAQINKELENEAIDLLGWNYIRMFNAEEKKK